MIFRYVKRNVFDKRICFNNRIMTQVGPEVLAARCNVMQMHHLGILTLKNLLKQTILATGWTIPGSNPGGRDFPHPSGPALESGYSISVPGVKRPGRGVNHPTPSYAEVKKKQ